MLEKVLTILGNYGYSVEFTDGDFFDGSKLYLYRTGQEEFVSQLSPGADPVWKNVVELIVQALDKHENPARDDDSEDDWPQTKDVVKDDTDDDDYEEDDIGAGYRRRIYGGKNYK